MDIETLWVFVICTIFLVAGIIGATYHYKRVNSWDKRPSSSEYMECLFIGWSAWMLIALSAPFTLISLGYLVIDVLKG